MFFNFRNFPYSWRKSVYCDLPSILSIPTGDLCSTSGARVVCKKPLFNAPCMVNVQPTTGQSNNASLDQIVVAKCAFFVRVKAWEIFIVSYLYLNKVDFGSTNVIINELLVEKIVLARPKIIKIIKIIDRSFWWSIIRIRFLIYHWLLSLPFSSQVPVMQHWQKYITCNSHQLEDKEATRKLRIHLHLVVQKEDQ